MDVSTLVQHNPDHFSEDFGEWIEENVHIWKAFEREALEIHSRGQKHYSARTIVEFLRHHSAIRERGGMWKINNDCVPYLARLFVFLYPEANNLFEFRKVTVKNKQKSLF
jgi:hypothetical protein